MDQLFVHAQILSLDRLAGDALWVRDGRILTAGDGATLKTAFPATGTVIDCQGGTLMPSFIDAHSHLTSYAQTLGLVNLKDCTSYDDIISCFVSYINQNPPKEGQWVMGFGYDHNRLNEKKHPTNQTLNRISSHIPILMTHASGHMGVLNTPAMKLAGIGPDTPDPEGGHFGRENGVPNGYAEENAFIRIAAGVEGPDAEQLARQLEQAQRKYLARGITTVQEGLVKPAEWSQLQAAAEAGRLMVDVVGYCDMKEHRALLRQAGGYGEGYHNRLRLGGYKIFLDGSPQGRTAWMSEPYEPVQEGYCGYPIYQDEEVRHFVAQAVDEGRQLLAHANGDAAAEQLISAYEAVMSQRPGRNTARPVMIHAQTVRPDQLPRMSALSMIASFFVAHIPAWGDIHIQNLGLKRASGISPCASAQKAGVTFTFHQDTPVLEPDMLHTVQAAVLRQTDGGRLLGEQERISPLEAIRAVTINGAYQYGEEQAKGTLAPGKRADLVLLDGNPLACPAQQIGKLQVMRTIKDGHTLFEA